MSGERVQRIRECLEAALSPQFLEVIDESHLHAGHASAGGKGHFRVRVVSGRFSGLGLLQRHRLVYDALSELMEQEIHALAIEARTPEESNRPKES